MLQMQANQYLLLQPWILAEHISSILISGNFFRMPFDVSWGSAYCDIEKVLHILHIVHIILHIYVTICKIICKHQNQYAE